MKRTRWEYIETENSRDLSALGQDGWELVSVVAVGERVTFYMKRPALSLREELTLSQREHVMNALGEGGAS